jgi:hypothetical protein
LWRTLATRQAVNGGQAGERLKALSTVRAVKSGRLASNKRTY